MGKAGQRLAGVKENQEETLLTQNQKHYPTILSANSAPFSIPHTMWSIAAADHKKSRSANVMS
jgi:hypothetical protein